MKKLFTLFSLLCLLGIFGANAQSVGIPIEITSSTGVENPEKYVYYGMQMDNQWSETASFDYTISTQYVYIHAASGYSVSISSNNTTLIGEGTGSIASWSFMDVQDVNYIQLTFKVQSVTEEQIKDFKLTFDVSKDAGGGTETTPFTSYNISLNYSNSNLVSNATFSYLVGASENADASVSNGQITIEKEPYSGMPYGTLTITLVDNSNVSSVSATYSSVAGTNGATQTQENVQLYPQESYDGPNIWEIQGIPLTASSISVDFILNTPQSNNVILNISGEEGLSNAYNYVSILNLSYENVSSGDNSNYKYVSNPVSPVAASNDIPLTAETGAIVVQPNEDYSVVCTTASSAAFNAYVLESEQDVTTYNSKYGVAFSVGDLVIEYNTTVPQYNPGYTLAITVSEGAITPVETITYKIPVTYTPADAVVSATFMGEKLVDPKEIIATTTTASDAVTKGYMVFKFADAARAQGATGYYTTESNEQVELTININDNQGQFELPFTVAKSVSITISGYSGVASLNSISGEDVIYNLQGVKVNNPVKGGLYIINGKKVIVK